MPQVRGRVCSWRYTVYGIPPACYLREYVIVLPAQIQIPHEDLQQAVNPPDQHVWDGCPEEGSILCLLGL